MTSPSRRIRTALALAVVLAFAVACGGGSDRGSSTTLRASVGGVTVELTVPDGALPDGMSADTTSIEMVSGPATGWTDPGASELIAITLEPGGTTFKQPLELVIDLGSDGRSVLGMVLVSAETPGADVEAVAYDFKLEDGAEASSAVVVRLSHFSRLRVTLTADTISPRALVEPPDRSILVGERFTVEAALLVPDIEPEETFGNPSFWRAPFVERTRTALDEPWQLHYAWRVLGTASRPTVVQPVFVAVGFDSGGPLDLEAREPAVITQQYQCVAPGPFILRLAGLAKIATVTTTIYDRDIPSSSGRDDVSRTTGVSSFWLDPLTLFGECVAAPATASPTPTPTPTPEQDDEDSSASDDEFETVGVDVLVIGGEQFPIERFDLASRDACEKEHYHSPLPAHSLQGGTPFDPGGCGLGTVDDVIFVEVPFDAWTAYATR